MPDPNPAFVEWPFPPENPCDEGLIRTPRLICNGMGEWVPDYTAPEGEGSATEGILPSPQKKPCGGCDPVALVRLGAEIYRDGFEHGFRLSSR